MKFSLACLAAVVLAWQAGIAAEIKIGVVAELTGDMPAVGASCKQAALMAVDEVNGAGGLKVGGVAYTIDLQIEDNSAKADQSALVTQKLIAQDRVLAIIGPSASIGAVPASAIAESGRTVMITPWSTNPKTTKDIRTGRPKRYVFRACYTDAFEGQVLAMFVLNQLKFKRAAALYDVASEAPTSQSELFRRIFTEKGGVMTAFETYTTGDRDFSAQLTKIMASNPDIIFLPAYYNDVPLVVTQAKRLGVKAPFLGSDAWSSPELITLSQGAVEGYYFANHYAADIATPAAQKFIQAYKARYNSLPDDVAALTYDAFGLLFQALKQVDQPEREALRNALSAITRYEGVTGNMRFQEGSGDPIKSAVILQVKNGRFVWFANANP
ncbi:MAG: ABC transporter substrate-binding protein [Verrucomicrobia bacterium]|nr:ABC transporter substrate-binding protein [Verrucomicrobiota bacterium]MBU1736295.1 ABC transporter substrate-binding protein [Verrucomicrobiota bacterium]MBU1857410.1 ABC transporter substrate-binding protein [Verrucomicrobiota bacterium]